MEKLSNARLVYLSSLATVSAVGAWVVDALGGWDNSLQTLIAFMAVDYVLGIIIALVWHVSPKSRDGTFESEASFQGLLRKGCILLVVYIAARLDLLFCDGQFIRTAVILFFIANEGFSIIENLGIMGVPMPPVIKDAFAAIKKQSESDNTNTKN